MLGNTSDRYGLLSRALHWLTAALIIALIAVGLYMTGLDKDDPSRRAIYNLHKSIGVLTLVLLIARLFWLRLSTAPALPAVLAAIEVKLVKGVKGALYLLMLLVPFSGYLMSNAGGYPVSFFGLFTVPALFAKNEALGDFAHGAHSVAAYLLALLVLVHVAGSVKHRLKGNVEADLLKRML